MAGLQVRYQTVSQMTVGGRGTESSVVDPTLLLSTTLGGLNRLKERWAWPDEGHEAPEGISFLVA